MISQTLLALLTDMSDHGLPALLPCVETICTLYPTQATAMLEPVLAMIINELISDPPTRERMHDYVVSLCVVRY